MRNYSPVPHALTCTLLLLTNSCSTEGTRTTYRPPPEGSAVERPTFATVVVDFSASFAPLTQTDRLALKETSRSLAELAIHEWTPPTTIVWRKIGAASVKPPPLCDVLEFKRSIIGAAIAAERLKSQLSGCAESIVRESRSPRAQEPHTDIVGAIMTAAQNWADIDGRKVLIILSDFQEDLPNARGASPIQLHDEAVLLLHRPGSTEDDDPAIYLDRIDVWRRRLLAAGAHSVTSLPTFRATTPTVIEALTTKTAAGTSVSIVNDLSSRATDSNILKSAVGALAGGLAKRAAEWQAPVSASWFATAQPAWRTATVAPVVYTPRLARRNNEVNTTEALRIALEEMGLALAARPDNSYGDLDGALRLISNSETTPHRYLILLSDFTSAAPATQNAKLAGEHVLLIYRTLTATDGQRFFQRLREWQSYFQRAGVRRVCTLDLMTLTEAGIRSCTEP
jgi:hypothetical protein